jgi:hypothetical protein
MPIIHGDTSKIRKILKDEYQATWCSKSKFFYIVNKDKWKKAQDFVYEFEKTELLREKEIEEKYDNKIKKIQEKAKNSVTDIINKLYEIDEIPTQIETMQAFNLAKSAMYKYVIAARNDEYKEFYFKYEDFCKLVGFGRNLRKSGLKSVGIARIAHKLNIISKILGWKKANT